MEKFFSQIFRALAIILRIFPRIFLYNLTVNNQVSLVLELVFQKNGSIENLLSVKYFRDI